MAALRPTSLRHTVRVLSLPLSKVFVLPPCKVLWHRWPCTIPRTIGWVLLASRQPTDSPKEFGVDFLTSRERLCLMILVRPSWVCNLNRLRRHPIPWTPLIRTTRSPTRPRQPTTLRRVWTRSRVESRSLWWSLSRTCASLLLAVRTKKVSLLRRTRRLAALTSCRTPTCPPLRPLSPVTPTRHAGLRPNVPLTSPRRPTTPWTAACVTPRNATPTPCIQSLPWSGTSLPRQQLTSLRRHLTPLLTTVAPTLLPVLSSNLKKLRKCVLSLIQPLPRWTILPLTSSPR